MEDLAFPNASRRSVLRTSALGVGAAVAGTAASVAGAQSALAAPAVRPAATATTSGGIFLKLDQIPGDSLVKGYEKTIEVIDASWEVLAETSWTKGGGASVGKPSPGSLALSLPTGSHTPWLLRRIATGASIATGKLSILRPAAGSATVPPVVLQLDLTALFLTSLAPHLSSASELYEDVTFVFKTIAFSYTPVDKAGLALKPITTSWDVSAGTVA